MECLVTKLKGVVSDSSLMGLNELRLTFHSGSDDTQKYVNLTFNEETTVKALNGGQISLQDGSGFASSVKVNANSATRVYFKKGDTEVSISNKHALTAIYNDKTILSDLDLDSLKYCENLASINCIVDSGVHGDFESLKNLPLSMLVLVNNDTVDYGNVIGDISFLDNIATKNVQRIFSGVTGELKKITRYLILFITSEEDGTSLNVISENNVDADCSNFQTQMNVKSLNLNWLSKCKNLKSLSNLFSDTRKDINVSGNVCTLARDLNISGNIYIKNAKGTDVQTLSDLPNSVYFLTQTNNIIDKSLLLPLTWSGNTNSRTDLLALENVHFKSGTAQFIKDMANLDNAHTSYSYLQRISIALADDLTSSAAAGDNALQTAISTLQGKGVTVSIGYSDTAANGIAVMSALDVDAPKYGIVYKGKELIIEPADTNKALIAPANDCTYKEFNSLEEAKAFIASNGLVKAESK